MNGYKLLEQAVRLTGVEQPDENLKIIGLSLLSAVAEDMGYRPPESLAQTVPFIGRTDRMTACYGLAMLIANAVGDEEQRSAFSDIYSRRLGSAKGCTSEVKDSIFKGGCL